MKRVRRHLTYANVMATLAVFIALGGGAYAVGKAAKDSVVTKSIENGAVTGKKLHRSAVNGSKVADGSLTGADIDVSSLGLLSTGQIVLRQNTKTIPSLKIDQSDNVIADCQQGERAISGGAYTSDSTAAVSESWPVANGGIATGWVVQYFNGGTKDLTNVQMIAYVMCAPA